MIAKDFRINDVVVSSLFTRYGYSVSYEKVTGPNSGFMQDGSYVEDVLRWRAVVSLKVIPLNETQLSFLLNTILPSTYIRLYYFDPMNNDYREEYFTIEGQPMTFRGQGADGNNYWTGYALTLKEARRSE